jgi:hypothetical protein
MAMQVGDPTKDHGCWERPEDMDTARTVYNISAARPGSDVAGETAAALAAASMVFRDDDPAYAARLLAGARSAFEFADEHKGAYSDDPELRAGGCPFYCDFDGYQVRVILVLFLNFFSFFVFCCFNLSLETKSFACCCCNASCCSGNSVVGIKTETLLRYLSHIKINDK